MPVGESIGGRVAMMVPTALLPVSSVIMVMELATEGRIAEGVAIRLRSFSAM